MHHPEDWRWNTYYHVAPARPTIAVIERPSLSYDEHADKRDRERGRPRVPFGFARALHEDELLGAGAGDGLKGILSTSATAETSSGPLTRDDVVRTFEQLRERY